MDTSLLVDTNEELRGLATELERSRKAQEEVVRQLQIMNEALEKLYQWQANGM